MSESFTDRNSLSNNPNINSLIALKSNKNIWINNIRINRKNREIFGAELIWRLDWNWLAVTPTTAETAAMIATSVWSTPTRMGPLMPTAY